MHTCKWILTRGPREGIVCNKKSVKSNKRYCSVHAKIMAKRSDKSKRSDEDTCQWIIHSRKTDLDRKCDRKTPGGLPYCSIHLKRKTAKYYLTLFNRDDTKCKWLIVTNKDQRQYRTPAPNCTKYAISGAEYCIVHMYTKQGWNETVRGIKPRCNHIVKSKKGQRVCQTIIEPGYKKCESHW